MRKPIIAGLTMPRPATPAEGLSTTTTHSTTTLHADVGSIPTVSVYSRLGSSPAGLEAHIVEERRRHHGRNEVGHDRPEPAVLQFLRTFRNPFVLILLFLVAVMLCTDVLFADPADGADPTGPITVGVMVLASVVVRFWQEYRSGRAAEALRAMVRSTATVTRTVGGTAVTRELPVDELVPGDVVELAAGDMVPADVRLVRTKDLQVNESMLTGEAMPAEKDADAVPTGRTEGMPNIGYMGTTVTAGSATGVVCATGVRTAFGSVSAAVLGARPETAFDAGIRKVSHTLIRFMLVMVPVVFVLNGLTKDWTSAFLFAVTTAVGLTPEMLPLVVSANLAKGARVMAQHRVIVKRMNAIQDLGAADVVCTDKTGTLTEDRIMLARHLDVHGQTSERTLGYAVANARFQTGLRNLLDRAVLDAAGDEVDRVERSYEYVDEMPFDFARRRMSVVLDDGRKHVIVTKGAPEQLLEICADELTRGGRRSLDRVRRTELDGLIREQNELGMRVLAVAIRDVDGVGQHDYLSADERDLTLVGFLTFLDPPKVTAKMAIRKLRRRGVAVKVVTGDNPVVTATVCEQVGIDASRVVLGDETDDLGLVALAALAEETDVFARCSPGQKARIVEALRSVNHTVGFLGDGVNDAPALRTADVGISVDSGTDVAKESADVILLKKDLTVLDRGVLEGRRTYVNTMKYLKMTASSNFGNMFSVLVASAILPFLPMIPAVVLVQNLAYDLSMLTLPWDRVDEQDVRRPRAWRSTGLARFMLRIGPISSVFDISTYALMWFVFAANTPAHAALFQSGWFVESIISQTLIVHMLRTGRLPFVQSRASAPILLATGTVCLFGLALPFTGFGAVLGMVPLPWEYFPWLVLTLVTYCVLTQIAKSSFVRKYGAWI